MVENLRQVGRQDAAREVNATIPRQIPYHGLFKPQNAACMAGQAVTMIEQ
jgi:hypothetical protein